MDYQLFLLAAIKEQHEKSGDAQLAVREGIARTGRPITNAAAIARACFVRWCGVLSKLDAGTEARGDRVLTTN